MSGTDGRDRVAIVTGVSRRAGIGFAIARRLLADGWRVLAQSWTPHDAAQPWGADPGGIEAVVATLAAGAPARPGTEVPPGAPARPGAEAAAASPGASGAAAVARRLAHLELDLADPAAPASLVEAAVGAFGRVDALIANHARSSTQSLGALTAEELDLAWAVNTRATLLLVQAFAAVHDPALAEGRVVLFTSGQHLGPMVMRSPTAPRRPPSPR